MTWKNLPPDFSFESFGGLLKLLKFSDSFALCCYSGICDTLVFLVRKAEINAQEYVASKSFESGGLLLGRTFINTGQSRSKIKYVVVVTGCVNADDATGTATALRMEPQLWSKANSIKNNNEFVVGWFHSHPNLGAFFSGTDRRTQASFFQDAHKVGWVIDPVRKEEAWFLGGNSDELPLQMIVRGDFKSLI